VIKLQRLNVVKIVESEVKAEALIRQGFELVMEQEEDKKPARGKKTTEGGD
jgi:hypothetical protein